MPFCLKILLDASWPVLAGLAYMEYAYLSVDKGYISIPIFKLRKNISG